MGKIKSVNPFSGQLLKEYESYSDDKMNEVLAFSEKAFKVWKDYSYEKRSSLFNKIAGKLREKKGYLSILMTSEMGKPIKEAEAEIEKCAWVCEYYAENAEFFLKDDLIISDASESYVEFDPLGCVLAIMPWNFPFWQVFRFAAPTIMAGNTGILKHASNVPQCALAIQDLFEEAGFPKGIFQSVLISGEETDKLIAHKTIKAVTLTGSEQAGMKVAASAGANLKKTVLELGGSDPFIVLKDANIEDAAMWAVKARMINNGQSCIAAKRFIVVNSVKNQFVESMTKAISGLKLGDPLLPEIQVGPLARKDLAESLFGQVQKSIALGASVVVGGIPPKGAMFSPTILENVKPGMPAFDEELFGPVAAIISVTNEQEAINMANQSKYGLGASIWTEDFEKGKALARQIESGSVFINGMVKSDPRLPFGGVKLSGYGRELAAFGIREFVNIKSVWVK
ncbi:MAG: NAD-dependent succinate-semialdehyde dehydrogenase [Sporocytophaga sp.]|uniref:NAD-dependent succinate-semialdehyde dehydrogenase n=1 Tax=Sporocytophaga sp. TaxID=2231183 RepID=UPI001B2B972C|nr:NAD-dependent succinate-semialdehyde dehydrogenase [Sporocytophaga sp.]MBO9700270.1 NAD-dependent succinate-semialdehyde dehydrogenase [Sporocytophaga sp.]